MSSRESISSSFSRIPLVCGTLVALPSAAILVGWYARIPGLRAPFPVGHPITPWGALCFLLLGVAVAIYGSTRTGTRLRMAGVIAATFVLIHSGATAAEYLSGRSFGIDSAFMRSRVLEWWASPGPPGRYALNAALAFAGVALALLLHGRKLFRISLTEVFSLFVGALALLGLVGYLYGVHDLSGLGQNVWMARNGAVLFEILSVGTFFLSSDYGLARLVTAPHSGGVMARRLLVTSVLSLLLLGWVAIRAIKGYNTTIEMGVACVIVASIIVTAALIFSTANKLDGLEQARRRDSLALFESAQRLQVASDAAGLGFWIWDTESRRLFASEKTKQLFGIQDAAEWFTAEEFMRRLPEADRMQLHTAGQELRSRPEFSIDFRVVQEDGAHRWLSVRGRRLTASSGRSQLFGVLWDITDQRRSEDALIRNEKLATVGRMAASIAHEVNNPLAAATNLLFLALSDESLEHGTREFLQGVEAELTRIAHITRQTLGFYREQQQPGEIQVEQLVAELRALYEARAGRRNIAFSLVVRPNVGTVFGNAGEIRQVLSNLVVNALDAMPNGGALRIRLSQVGSNVRITVADTGSGIDPVNRKRIFEAFFTTKENVGTGLGLWISRQIVERHKGRIRVRSVVGKGTVFAILLPASTAKAEAVPTLGD